MFDEGAMEAKYTIEAAKCGKRVLQLAERATAISSAHLNGHLGSDSGNY